MSTKVFDTETTGTEAGSDQVIEAAWLVLPETPAGFMACSRGLTELEEFCQRYKPDVEIKLGAQAVHHILASELDGMPPSASFELGQTSFLIGHNVDFDWRMIGEPDVPRICTLAISRKLFPNLDSHTQSAMIYHIARQFGIEAQAREMLRNAHAALDDVRNCAVLLRFLLKIIEQSGPVGSLEELHAFSETCRIPDRMTFGKHKGVLIADLDPGYARWYRGQPEQDPYLIKAFQLAGI